MGTYAVINCIILEAMVQRVPSNITNSTQVEQETWKSKRGDLVLTTDENYPPLQLPLGRVTHIYTGNDDLRSTGLQMFGRLPCFA